MTIMSKRSLCLVFVVFLTLVTLCHSDQFNPVIGAPPTRFGIGRANQIQELNATVHKLQRELSDFKKEMKIWKSCVGFFLYIAFTLSVSLYITFFKVFKKFEDYGIVVYRNY